MNEDMQKVLDETGRWLDGTMAPSAEYHAGAKFSEFRPVCALFQPEAQVHQRRAIRNVREWCALASRYESSGGYVDGKA